MRQEFRVGDKVSRPLDIYDEKSKVKFGRVREVRFGHWTAHSYEPVIYDIQWDGEADVSRGYLPHGINAAVDAPKDRDQ